MFDPAGAILFFLVGLLVAGSGRWMVILLAVVPVFWFGLWLQSDAALYGDGPIDPPFWIFCGLASAAAVALARAVRVTGRRLADSSGRRSRNARTTDA